MEFKQVTYQGWLTVYYTDQLDGGGSRYGQDFVRLVDERFGHVGRVFEWCAGPGFIGFSLLAHGLCDTLTLADFNPNAVEACRATVARNRLADRVTVYHADNLDGIPLAERWDLVVGNPPHSGAAVPVPRLSHRAPILYMDPGWLIHRGFYATVRSRLAPSATVAVVENRLFSSPGDFTMMIEDGGLEVVGIEECRYPEADCYYYVLSRPKEAVQTPGSRPVDQG